MNEKALDAAITASKNRPIPPAPQNLEANVLRCIRKGADDLALRASGWVDVILAPRVAMGLVAMVLASTLGVATATTLANTRPERRELASKTLDFTMFSSSEAFDFSYEPATDR